MFHYADSVVVLQGKAVAVVMPSLLPLLDGRHSREEIEMIFGERAGPAVAAALQALDAQHLLVDGPNVDVAHESSTMVAFLAATGGGESGLAAIAERLAATRIVIAGSGTIAEELGRTISEAGVGSLEIESLERYVTESHDACDLLIAAPGQAEASAMTALNRMMLDARQTWMQVLEYDGRFVAIGPVFVPWETACYECFLLRRRANVSYGDEFDALQRATALLAQPRVLATAAASIATLVAMRWIAFGDPTLPNAFQAFSPGFETNVSTHAVLRVPRCPACSVAAHSAPPMPWFEV